MAKTYKVDSPEEALKLAKQFRRTKKYDLFRGQNENWPVRSSLGRLSTKQIEINQNRLQWLFDFLYQYDKTKRYTEKADDFLAIAQHYGIATDFIDFTYSPDVAMFFATHSKRSLINKDGVIICLNSKDFKDTIDFCRVVFESRGLDPAYIYETKLDNLWRLSAQKGCFLQSTILNLDEVIYPFDKIIFPHKECLLNITENDIYPLNKSDLEILLDNHFAAERIDEGILRLSRFCSELGIEQTVIQKNPDSKYVKSMEWHSSWSDKNTEAWNYQVKESIKQHADIEIQFNIKTTGCFRRDVIEIKKRLGLILKNKKITRRNHIDPHIDFTPKIRSKRTLSLINKSVRNIWDGMRTLPYTRLQIIHAIAKYLALELHNTVMQFNPEEVYSSPILLEMSNHIGVPCRFHVSEYLIESVFRDDILEIQANSLPNFVSSKLLLYVQQAQVIFDFDRLTKLFAYEIIPSMMLRNKTFDRPILLFSPVYVDRIGYA